jgi:hypothetical protein
VLALAKAGEGKLIPARPEHRGSRSRTARTGRDSVFKFNVSIKAAAARIAVAAAGVAAAIGFWAAPAGASATSSTEHTSFPAAGAVFACQGGDLTVTGGTVNMVFHINQDAQGIIHVTGTSTPHNVTLTDASGNAYTLSGASWFGAKGTSETDIVVSTDTEHFVIHTASGGVYAKVQVIEHFNITPGGKVNVKSFNVGGCQPPQD